MNAGFKVSSACALIAVFTSGCFNSSVGTRSTSNAPLVIGYAKDTAEAPPPAETHYLGRAPHICTPSGFGRTSTCFSRS